MKWTEEVGLAVVKRDLVSLQLRSPNDKILDFTILQVFPFTSETKRMGIIVKVKFYVCKFSTINSMLYLCCI